MNKYDIQTASIEDISDLITFGKAEFIRHFGHLYTAQDLESYLASGYGVERYHSWMTDSHYQIWIARDKENYEIIGSVLCGMTGMPLENCVGGPYDSSRCGEINRMYVHPSAFGTGLAQNLMDLALEWLKQHYDQSIFLGVWSENLRAQRFYEKNGFEKVGEYDFAIGDHVDRDFIMILSNADRSLNCRQGNSEAVVTNEKSRTINQQIFGESMNKYDIQPATSEDINELITFGKAEFTRTFGHLYQPEDLEFYLSSSYGMEPFQSWISDSRYQIWIARDKESRDIGGYLLCGVTGLPLENCSGGPYDSSRCGEIKRMYLHPSTFGTGLAQTLMDLAVEWLKKHYDQSLFLGVWSLNFRAQRFYEKKGFEKIGEYDFPVGQHVDREFIMILSNTDGIHRV